MANMANDGVSTSLLSRGRQLSKANGATKDSAPPPSPRSFNGFSAVTSFLWSVADLLRGNYKQADYGKVILPLTVLRRLDCVLDKTKAKVLAKHDELKRAKHPEGTVEKMLLRASGTNGLWDCYTLAGCSRASCPPIPECVDRQGGPAAHRAVGLGMARGGPGEDWEEPAGEGAEACGGVR